MADTTFLDWPFFDTSHRDFARSLRRFAELEVDAWEELIASESVDVASMTLALRFGQGGWLQHVVPAAHGGARDTLDVRTLCLARETLAYHNGLADFAFAMQGLGSGPISLFGSEALKARYLPRVARGEAIAAFALSEPNAGSDVVAMSTTARREHDGWWRLDGEKTWISNGGIADFYTVFARYPEGGERAFAAFVVDADTPGFAVAERLDVIAPHPLARITFDAVRVPPTALIGEPGKGLRVALATLDVFRSTVGAAALGMARRALDEAVAHTRARRAFGQALSDFQLTQARLAEMALAVDASALLVYRAAWAKDTRGARVTREAAMAKLHATESAQQVIDSAVQLLGGRGIQVGNIVESLYREVRALRIYEGTSEIQKLVIAGQLLEAAKAMNDGTTSSAH
ncbi:MAG: acyl-CoA dehydrogenase family protein [Gemmatimonadaceae bacterium]|nr:acyl-CoA dehydrogenase family protein [Gemmatimonadaceae bacterium]